MFLDQYWIFYILVEFDWVNGRLCWAGLILRYCKPQDVWNKSVWKTIDILYVYGNHTSSEILALLITSVFSATN